MSEGKSGEPEALYRLAWRHIEREEFAEAERVLRRLLDATDPEDFLGLWGLSGQLAAVLNSLSRPGEATEMYRRAFAAACRSGDSTAIGPARVMLANQYLVHGDPLAALSEAEAVTDGAGHVQSMLHSVAALALWRLGRHHEARIVARRALDAAPTDWRRADVGRALRHVLRAG